MMAMTILAIVSVTFSTVLRFMSKTAVRSRQETAASEIAQKFFSRLNSVPYPYVFDLDSSKPKYGLAGNFGPVSNQTTSYPYLSAFDDVQTSLQPYKFDKFTFDIRFMTRDLSDINSDGSTADLRPFIDLNHDRIDDYDGGASSASLRYFDQNGDGDFNDTYFTSNEITEQPNTHLKEGTFRLYKGGQVVYQDVRLVSWEKFTGAEGKAAGASLRIVVSTPAENSAVYQQSNAAQAASLSVNLASVYPPEVSAVRGDPASPLRATGQTSPSAAINWTVETSTNPVLDVCASDANGDFDCALPNVTAALNEGMNTLYGQTIKTVYYSPWNATTFVYDVNPPTFTLTTALSTSTVKNRQPVVRAKYVDRPLIAGRQVSGVNLSVLRLAGANSPLVLSSNTLSYNYDPLTNDMTWVDSATGLPPVLSTGTYTVVFEGGDNAFYKARSTWTFTVDIGDFTDGSDPHIVNESPMGGAGTNMPTISCDVYDRQSGIMMNSISMILDGSVVVSSAAGNLYSAYQPNAAQSGGTLTYTPQSALSSGNHTVRVTVSHWGESPAGNVSSTDAWNFWVP